MGMCARIEHLSFSFAAPSGASLGAEADSAGKRPILSDVSLSVPDGDFLVVVGLTGSGKTTLLRHLSLHRNPVGTRRGTVTLWGQTPAQLRAEHQDHLIAQVPQRPREAIAAATLRQELELRLAGTADQELAATDIIGFLGLAHLLDKPIDHLSEGQAQLAALGAALSTRPRLLLLDEPTASLDSVSRRTTLDLLRRLNRDFGLTIVMTEHHLEGCCDIATHIAALDHGRLLADGTPEDALRSLWGANTDHSRELIPDVQRFFLMTGSGAKPPLPLTIALGQRRLAEMAVQTPTASIRAASAAASNAQDHTTSATAVISPASFAAPALRVGSLSYAYPGQRGFAVSDITFDARYGDVIALMGQSGCGKSTILDLLAGFLRPQFGSVRWRKRDAKKTVPPSRSQDFVGYLPQDVRPILNLAMGAVLGGTASIHDVPRRCRKVSRETPRETTRADCAAVLTVVDPLDQSLGQQQLQAFNLVTARHKPVVLLDEPTQGLDAVGAAHVGEALRRAGREGGLVLFSSHDPDFCVRYATRALVVLAGQLVADTDPRSVVASQKFSTTPMHRLFAVRDPSVLTLDDAIARHSFPLAPLPITHPVKEIP
ncbi:MAG: ATP-binding cassette domain-containing protein [Aeriscardovia sp.]|nr:ATP-binding cassette domain-containing protein [Aeriscardovia sp.]